MRCPACGRDNVPNALFCFDCAAELVPGAAKELEPPRARDRRARWVAAGQQRFQREWEDLGYSLRRVRPDWGDSLDTAKRVALVLSSLTPGLGHALSGQPRRGAVVLAVFLVSAAGWLVFMGTAFSGLMGFVMVSAVCTSVVDCLRVAFRGRQARAHVSDALWALAIVFGTYALGLWLVSQRWQRVVVNLPIVRLASPESRTGPAPVFAAGDRLFVSRAAYRHRAAARGDVVLAQVDGQETVQRVIAVPGDRLEFSGGVFWLNGQPLDESRYPLQALNAIAVHGDAHIVSPPWSGTVRDRECLVWGLQADAHGPTVDVGPTVIRQASLLGKVWVVYSPYHHRRILNHADPAIGRADQGG